MEIRKFGVVFGAFLLLVAGLVGEPIPVVFDRDGLAVFEAGTYSKLGQPALLVPPLDNPLELYLDGRLVFRSGSVEEPQAWTTFDYLVIEVPESRQGSGPPLVQMVLHQGDPRHLLPPTLLLGELDELRPLAFWSNVVYERTVQTFALLAAFFALLSIGIWLSVDKWRSRALLLYGAYCAFFFLSWINHGLAGAGIDELVLYHLKAPATILCVFVFNLYLFEKMGKLRASGSAFAVLGAVLLPILAYLVTSPTLTAHLGRTWLGEATIVGLQALSVVFTAWYAVRERSRSARRALVLAALCLAALAADFGLRRLLGHRPPQMSSYVSMAIMLDFILQFYRDLAAKSEAVARKASELTKLNAHLQAEVDERNRALNRFVAVLSHDLRSALFGVRQLAGALASGSDARLHRLEEVAQQAEGALSSLLRLSVFSSAEVRPEVKVCHAAALWDEALLGLQPSLQLKQLVIDRRGDDEVSTDPRISSMILRNLLHNAAKFSPHGGRIVLRVSRCEEFVALSVQDEGPGLSPGEVEGLFDLEHHRLNDGPDAKSGFGLVLCRDYAQRLGHRLAVVSELGHGATFSLVIPD